MHSKQLINGAAQKGTILEIDRNTLKLINHMSTLVAMPSTVAGFSSSASGILLYLQETDTNLKVRALQKLYQVIDIYWAEVCNSLSDIEALSEDSTFPACDLAAAIASKCFYHLQEYNDALRLALCSGRYFDISFESEYVDTMLARCIDEYKSLRTKPVSFDSMSASSDAAVIDPRMEAIMEMMFQRCYKDNCFDQAMGVALDTLRIDKVEEICKLSIDSGKEHILGYTFDLCQNGRYISSREFRLAVIDVLVKLNGTLQNPDYSTACFGLQYLNRPAEVATILDGLCRGTVEKALIAYQIAFDLQEAENQGFVLQIVAHFKTLSGAVATDAAGSADASGSMVTEEDEMYQKHLANLRRILVDGFDVDLTLNFLFKQSRSDMGVLKAIKTAIEARSNILHNAAVVAHAYMNSGTTQDTFLRENLEWLGKASNWSKFTAVGSIGVVHKGHVHESMNLLQPYLPTQGQSTSPYTESGALYALGLIHANKGGSGDSATITFLTEALRNSGTNEIVQHGACLGIGLAAMATNDDKLFDTLNQVLLSDGAEAGEGAALGLGLLMLGQSESQKALENIPILLNYAHDTSHEKIIRALALAIAMMVYGKEESANVIIEQLTRDRDPIVRYGGMYAMAMAYCGTANNSIIKKLLHVAVSDVNDDVRRAAVTCLGFINFREPETVPKLVALLAESFNPHVRYGACMAIGVACAGSALKDAIDLLSPMLEDPSDFVRQGAVMSMALVLQQASEARSPSVKKIRDHILQVINDKHQTNMAKSGAILAAGILDAGGKNVCVSMQSRAGFLKMGGAVGMMMFLQYWYWYPLKLFLSLSFSATSLIGLNKDFDMPTNFEVTCHAPPSMFAYPKVDEEKKDEKKLVATAVLSTTARTKARDARKEARKGLGCASPRSMDSPGDGPSMERVQSHLSTASYLTLEGEDKMSEPATSPAKPTKFREPTSFQMSNPSRLVPAQLKYISLQTEQRYVPVCRRNCPSGIVMLFDSDPVAPEQVAIVERVALGAEDEATPPAPFEWDPNAE